VCEYADLIVGEREAFQMHDAGERAADPVDAVGLRAELAELPAPAEPFQARQLVLKEPQTLQPRASLEALNSGKRRDV
jgi:hypothetical protein